MPAGATVKQIAMGAGHACVIASDKKVYCWGGGSNGQLGNGLTTATQTTPVAVSQGAMPAGATVKQIAAGVAHNCVIASDSKTYCWGAGTSGQLGNSSTASDMTTPVAVVQGATPAGSTFTQITGGTNYTCAIASDSKGYCWGLASSYQLGNGSTATQAAPVAVQQGAMPTGAVLQLIAAGATHTCAIASDSIGYCWGAGTNGRLGNGSTSQQTSPSALSDGQMPWAVTTSSVTLTFILY
jgi:alpha-tubulin suppressor-like RCC1 family protein